MKKTKFLAYLLAGVLCSTAFVSCDKDDDDDNKKVTGGTTSTFVVDQNNLKGEIKDGVVTLEEKIYTLTGGLVVKAGAKLVIPAGAKIVADEPASNDIAVRYIAVAQDATIEVNGTKEKPVVMTCISEKAEAWGGLVICGNAPTNKGTSVTSEVGDLTYGGTKTNDSSGSLKYLVVKYTGLKFTNDKEFNGISFFGVGAGTTVEYVASIDGGDDGLEFFGGTVNPKYLVSINSGDDGIDFADGWSGTGMNWYVKDAAKSSIEGSNNGDDGSATPMTNAKLSNLTLIGSGEKPWFLKEGAGMQTIDNVVIGGLKDGKDHAYFYMDDSDTDAAARVTAGDIKITNVKFMDDTRPQAAGDLTVTEKADATGAGNGGDTPTWAAGWSEM